MFISHSPQHLLLVFLQQQQNECRVGKRRSLFYVLHHLEVILFLDMYREKDAIGSIMQACKDSHCFLWRGTGDHPMTGVPE
jgi:hypothetical protein